MSQPSRLSTSRVRELRGPKDAIATDRYLQLQWDDERDIDEQVRRALTVFLAGAECPFTCVFCDLWRYTTDDPTPEGAIAHQVSAAVADAGHIAPDTTIKLYNASNFFEPRAVPVGDRPAVAEAVSSFGRVVVECHPRLVGAACREFAEALTPRLEVAMGLETCNPDALARLNKGMTLDDFDRAATQLTEQDIAIRAFVLVGAPFVPAVESRAWTRRSVEYAVERGATHVSLIPVRSGNGTLEVLREEGLFSPPSLADLETSLRDCLEFGPAVITADLWDAWRFADCPECNTERLARLVEMNRTGQRLPEQLCSVCGA